MTATMRVVTLTTLLFMLSYIRYVASLFLFKVLCLPVGLAGQSAKLSTFLRDLQTFQLKKASTDLRQDINVAI